MSASALLVSRAAAMVQIFSVTEAMRAAANSGFIKILSDTTHPEFEDGKHGRDYEPACNRSSDCSVQQIGFIWKEADQANPAYVNSDNCAATQETPQVVATDPTRSELAEHCPAENDEGDVRHRGACCCDP